VVLDKYVVPDVSKIHDVFIFSFKESKSQLNIQEDVSLHKP
jgi:hypothetical protein